jgi:hypothetical protein
VVVSMRTDTVARPVIAPYITAWGSEVGPVPALVEVPGSGIAYADERVSDRDGRGVLWLRSSWAPGKGRPVFGQVHPMRQRRAMRLLLCQVCGGPADRTEDGVLWLVKDHRDDWPGWPDGTGETEPPICRDCVQLSVRLCPALRRGAVLIRARRYPIAGVRGALYTGGPAPRMVGDVAVGFGSNRIRWVVAVNLARELNDCTLIEVDDLT